MGWWMVFGGIVWLLFLVTVVWLAITLIARTSPTAKPPDAGDSAREIARQRYARGEIDRDAYLQIMEDLDSQPDARNRGQSDPE